MTATTLPAAPATYPATRLGRDRRTVAMGCTRARQRPVHRGRVRREHTHRRQESRTMKRLMLGAIIAAGLFTGQAGADHYPVREFRVADQPGDRYHPNGITETWFDIRYLPPGPLGKEYSPGVDPLFFVHEFTGAPIGGGKPYIGSSTQNGPAASVLHGDWYANSPHYAPGPSKRLSPGTDYRVTITTYPSVALYQGAGSYGNGIPDRRINREHPTRQSITIRTAGQRPDPPPPPPPPPPTPPAAPAPVCRVADDTLTVTWPPVTGATQYTRRLGTASGTMASATTGRATTWSITGADLRKLPAYRRAYVNAGNDAGTSAYRFCAFETPPEPPPSTPPGAPAPVCRVANDTLTVTWPPVTGATQYTRRLGTASGTMASATTGHATTWSITGADLRKLPAYRRAYVNAGNDAGTSAYRFCAFETPPEAETDADVCRWEHRFNTFPATDSAGRGVLRITARKKGASVRIKAFDRDDGAALHVQDLDNDRLLTDAAVTLGAANTVERFAVDGDSGQHVLIVSHAEHVAGMRAVTAMMVRRSGDTSQVIHPDVVKHCEPTGTETTP